MAIVRVAFDQNRMAERKAVDHDCGLDGRVDFKDLGDGGRTTGGIPRCRYCK